MIARAVVTGAVVAMLLSSCAAGTSAPTGSRAKDDSESNSSSSAGPSPKDRARPANDFSVTTFDGGSFSLARSRGTPVVLNFWESW